MLVKGGRVQIEFIFIPLIILTVVIIALILNKDSSSSAPAPGPPAPGPPGPPTGPGAGQKTGYEPSAEEGGSAADLIDAATDLATDTLDQQTTDANNSLAEIAEQTLIQIPEGYKRILEDKGDCPGVSNIGSAFSGVSTADCGKKCTQTAGCYGISYNPLGQLCYLKNFDRKCYDKKNITENNGYTYFAKIISQPSEYTMGKGSCSQAFTYQSNTGGSFDDCKKRCDSLKSNSLSGRPCYGFGYNYYTKGCRPKNAGCAGNDGTVSKDGYIFYKKNEAPPEFKFNANSKYMLKNTATGNCLANNSHDGNYGTKGGWMTTQACDIDAKEQTFQAKKLEGSGSAYDLDEALGFQVYSPQGPVNNTCMSHGYNNKGGNVVRWTCALNDANDWFIPKKVPGTHSTYIFSNWYGDKDGDKHGQQASSSNPDGGPFCLEQKGNSAAIQLQTCNINDKNQQFTIVDSPF